MAASCALLWLGRSRAAPGARRIRSSPSHEQRNGTPISLSFADSERALECEFEDIIAIDDASTKLDALNPRLRQIVELRFFAGIREPEIAELLGVSVRTVERDWLKARMFLFRELRATRS